MIIIHGIKLKLGQDTGKLLRKAERQLGLELGAIDSVRIVKESLDAREKPVLYRVFSLELISQKTDESLIEACNRTNTRYTAENPVRFEIRALQRHTEASSDLKAKPGEAKTTGGDDVPRPIVVGYGPCGIFAALALAEYGLRPVVLERGGRMKERVAAVERFWNGGPLDPECNVQFGEGGAGTFSDGKLTTGTKSPYSRWILENFVDAGASPDILIKQKPHIGTDVLRSVVVNLRKNTEALGGEVRFGCRLTEVLIENGAVRGVRYMQNGTEKTLVTDTVILALGHSARDTIRALCAEGIRMEQKPFSMGVRIEHPQRLIDLAQYGAPHEELGIGPADYKLNVKTASGRGVYTFCMCPGGYVIDASSVPGMLAVNGMSNSDRGSGTANSALLADVLPEDYDSDHPLAGVAFQEKYERLAFELGGGKPPKQTVGSFMDKTQPGIDGCLPGFVSGALREAMPKLGRKLKGFDSPDALMTAVESRSSSPVRVKRDPETLEAFASGPSGDTAAIKGLYPAGEGAGYAGGIMSAAADGVRIAVKIAEQTH
ncbi:MAG: NAD(FAD)-utilizing dehydrogenase [Firmicutes bacterium]|nr:NAD(FAD)-utilizing dehydrogenase [Bacillota bacterium]